VNLLLEKLNRLSQGIVCDQMAFLEWLLAQWTVKIVVYILFDFGSFVVSLYSALETISHDWILHQLVGNRTAIQLLVFIGLI
jgi:hypothetical protein